MIDLGQIEGFDWDLGNLGKSLEKHGVTPAEAEQVFAAQPLLATDTAHSKDENRYQALGQTDDGRQLHVSFTLRDSGKRIRVISARNMSRKERAIYAEQD